MKKLTIIGGGSVRAPFFANSLAKRAHTLHISTLCLYDIDSVSSAVSQSTQLRRLPQIFR